MSAYEADTSWNMGIPWFRKNINTTEFALSSVLLLYLMYQRGYQMQDILILSE